MKILDGKELAGFIKERQAKQVRGLRQGYETIPKLSIVITVDNPVIDTYVRLKKEYAEEILIDVDVHRVKQAEVKTVLKELNNDETVNGIIIQLPLDDPSQTEELVNLVSPKKDVDGLGQKPDFEPATPLAIMWLLSAYNVQLNGKEILIVGQGRLVGLPLKQVMEESGLQPKIANKQTKDLKSLTEQADVLVTATGVAGLIKSDMIKENAVVVDAGVAGEGGKTVGDVDPSVHEERIDLTITPTKGGVGPLTICALFDNVILAAARLIEKN
jgi:methylenetetrahydrofolate dehydrogenase (NADP+)/methenyltetrahydrofolate cyclohydrolase